MLDKQKKQCYNKDVNKTNKQKKERGVHYGNNKNHKSRRN